MKINNQEKKFYFSHLLAAYPERTKQNRFRKSKGLTKLHRKINTQKLKNRKKILCMNFTEEFANNRCRASESDDIFGDGS